jgi:hypothetical protein
VRIRKKSCDRCQLSAEILYRVLVVGVAAAEAEISPMKNRADRWQFVCNDCLQMISLTNPDYVYGGTWKARKR